MHSKTLVVIKNGIERHRLLQTELASRSNPGNQECSSRVFARDAHIPAPKKYHADTTVGLTTRLDDTLSTECECAQHIHDVHQARVVSHTISEDPRKYGEKQWTLANHKKNALHAFRSMQLVWQINAQADTRCAYRDSNSMSAIKAEAPQYLGAPPPGDTEKRLTAERTDC
ncbi:unnamed protein product [Ectocarpus fasciculatus]